MLSFDEGVTMAKANRGRSNRGNRGNSGRGSSGRTFRVIGAKKRKPGRPRKVRRPLAPGFIGIPPELRRAQEPDPVEEMTGDVDDVAEENAPKGEDESATAQKRGE